MYNPWAMSELCLPCACAPICAAVLGGGSICPARVRRFALHVPENLPLVAAAPLLCAGITPYSPMKHYGLDKAGQKLAVVGLGGLGHMAVKFGKGEPLGDMARAWLPDLPEKLSGLTLQTQGPGYQHL